MKFSPAILACCFYLLILLFYRCGNEGTAKDIDGNIYKTVTIGNQAWMAENLKTSRFRNGDSIPNITDNASWEALATAAWCFYNNDSSLGQTYGSLYNWYAVQDARGLCPEGWHVPSDDEFKALISYLGGDSVAGGKMKALGLWNEPNQGATNQSNFTALPGGYRYFTGNSKLMGNYSGFWSSSEGNSDFSWLLYLNFNDFAASRIFFGKKNGLSCRCVKD